jgi:hypothetical protein
MGDYRLKWFEMGTVERFTSNKIKNFSKRKSNKTYKKPRYGVPKGTGKEKSGWFFKDAIETKQQEVSNEINKTLSEEIKKRFNK